MKCPAAGRTCSVAWGGAQRGRACTYDEEAGAALPAEALVVRLHEETECRSLSVAHTRCFCGFARKANHCCSFCLPVKFGPNNRPFMHENPMIRA